MKIITLPIPAAKLSANSRCHWSVKAKLTKRHRQIGNRAAWLQHPKKFVAKSYKLVFYWPDRRRRDKRNASERCKAYEDGIADWLGQDDSEWGFNGVQFGEPDKGNPRVEFWFEEK